MAAIYIKSRTPGTADGRTWEDVCHSRDPFYWISHEEWRPTSRWQAVPRKKQFQVERFSRNKQGSLRKTRVGFYATLERAVRAAEEWEQTLARCTGLRPRNSETAR